jgi:hypothetical protein
MTKLIKIFASSCLIFITSIVFASAADNISGSTWVIIHDGHKNVHRFNSDGTCPYFMEKSSSGNEGEMYDNCTWVQNDSVLVIEFNNYYMVLTGIIKGKSMTGYYVTNREDSGGTFNGERSK